MWDEYHNVDSADEAISLLTRMGDQARIVAGATDLMLEIERGNRKGITTLIDISRAADLEQITLDADEIIHIGPMVTHNQCVGSKLIQERAFPLAQAAFSVGSPQIRNRGTIAGNIITASPANDTISPLMALDANLTLRSKSGNRVIPMKEFYKGVRQTQLKPDEMLVDISFPAMKTNQRGLFIKLGLRKAQAVSVINVTIILTMSNKLVEQATITLGAVAPTIIHATKSEEALIGSNLREDIIVKASQLAAQAAHPIDDIRSSLEYRREAVKVCVERGLTVLSQQDKQMVTFPETPILLWGNTVPRSYPEMYVCNFQKENLPIMTRINGQIFTFYKGQNKSLLRLLREDAGLIGTKEGCTEGECGACTVFLDGKAVMSCLIPAPRAHHADIVTIEGISKDGQLHPLQQAFITEGAVQCGYCTPGFIMAGVKLIEERNDLSYQQIQQGLTGNLCRCTGYYKIIKAVERTIQEMAHV